MTCDIAQGETSQGKKWKGVMVCDISPVAMFSFIQQNKQLNQFSKQPNVEFSSKLTIHETNKMQPQSGTIWNNDYLTTFFTYFPTIYGPIYNGRIILFVILSL